MDRQSLVAELDRVLPGFAAYLRSPDNLFDSGSFCSAFAACSQFVRERPVAAWAALARIVNQVVTGPNAVASEAACTCLLENLAEPGHPLKPFLEGEALRYWIAWEPSRMLEWEEGAPAQAVTSREELEARLQTIAAASVGRPVVARVSLPDDTTVHIGLGRAEAMVFVHDPPSPDGLTMEWISVGEERRRGEVSFWFLGDHNTYEKRSFLPVGDAIRAVGELFETGRRPTWIQWEENAF
jgi:hypothetical protein